MEIQHFLHNHPLKFYENSDFDDLDCSGCGNSLSVQTYGCVGCEFFLHKSCAKLPREIQHFFHPCTLFLRIGSYVCNACYSNHSRTFGYRCKRCDFDLDVDCARLSTMKSEGDEDQIQHYSHRHPLKFLAKMGDEVLCQICEKVCSDNVYNCRPCNFYIHKSCKDMLPQKLQVFFHPCQLVLLTTPSYYCDACEKDSSGLTFRCGKCYFQLCVKCFRSSSASKSEGKQIEHFMREMEIQHFLHEHTLKLYKNSDFDDLDCSGCGNSLSVQTYGCVGCEFFLHKSCAKLPREIQHFFHPCTLFLRIGSYVCNACYSNHSRTFGYRCKRCDFDLDVDCARLSTMKSEGDEDQIQHYSHRHPLKFLAKMGDEVLCQICEKVMASLKGKRGNVELRIVGRYISSKMISKELAIEETEQNEIVKDASKSKYIESMAVLFDDILVSLEAAERKQLDDIEEAIRKGIETNITSLESSSEYTSSFAYSEEAFKRFMDRLDSVILDYQIPDFILEHEEFITFQDYLIPRTLIPTFQDLLSKNEDICAGSMLSPKAKSLIFYFLCGVIENMRATRIVDITDQKLGEWFACLKWVKYVGFKFQFIFEHMKYLAHAHFVVQARKRVEDFPVQLKQEIAQISQEIDKLKVKLRELEDQQEFYQRQEKSIRSSLTKQHCDVPSAIKWKPAADGLL
ncbi:hypothetical protein GH714_005558 [Hevea brasiliensis]|uniref:Phorbol-ester/DAG-type domain-containing protein n=1 Tax=Hevea brasiliensis TaxID=3981 RepID=A0A6A6KXZ7_HEVBR|nr:hypothetical protein GH714_005558 [Hevea brasiliensis]